jgi:hypothetical protein
MRKTLKDRETEPTKYSTNIIDRNELKHGRRETGRRKRERERET